MLEAGWQLYEGEYFRHRVEISNKELEFLTNRMSSLGTTGSILAGFAFTALVELEISPDIEDDLTEVGYAFTESIYFIATGATVQRLMLERSRSYCMHSSPALVGQLALQMAAGVYIVVVATIAVMKAQRMALHGHVELDFLREELPANLGYRPGMIGENPSTAGSSRENAANLSPEEVEQLAALQAQQAQSDDVQQAIHALRKVQPTLLYAFGFSLTAFVLAAIAMSWIKTSYHHLQVKHRPGQEDAPNTIAIVLTCTFGALGLAISGVRARD